MYDQQLYQHLLNRIVEELNAVNVDTTLDNEALIAAYKDIYGELPHLQQYTALLTSSDRQRKIELAAYDLHEALETAKAETTEYEYVELLELSSEYEKNYPDENK